MDGASDDPGATPQRLRRAAPRALAMAGALVMVVLWVGVNIFPSITNDSLTFLAHANDLPGGGLVDLGYRQVGYPAFAALSRAIGDTVGANPMLWIALVQRALLAVAVVYLVWLWRWWSLPLLVIAAAPSFVAYSNQILTEGLGIPTALLLVATTTHVVVVLQNRPEARGVTWDSERGRRIVALLVAATALLAFVAASVRVTYITLGIAPLVVAYVAWQYERRALRVAVGGLLAYLVVVGLFTVGVAVENRAEYGRFSPATRTARTEYWSAYTLVFRVYGDDPANERLAQFREEGPYGFIHPVDEIDDLDVSDALFEEKRAELLDAAGLDHRREKIRAFAGALVGGRMDDWRHVVTQHSRAGLRQVLDEIYRARHARPLGRSGINERFNGGVPITAVVTDGIVPDLRYPYFGRFLPLLLVLSLVAAVAGLFRRRTRGLAIALAAPLLAMSLAAGLTLADNVRFLLITSVWAVALSGPLLALVWDEVRAPSD